MKMRNVHKVVVSALFFTLSLSLISGVAYAKTKGEINAGVRAAMEHFKKHVKGGTAYLEGAKGVLVMPGITKAGFVIGGKYGQGALLVHGKPVDYYSLAEGSVGWQIGAEKYDMVILFMTDKVLHRFLKSDNWEAGVDAEITLIDVGAAVSVETLRSQHPIAGFIFDQRGLMGGVSLKGAKFTRIHPE